MYPNNKKITWTRWKYIEVDTTKIRILELIKIKELEDIKKRYLTKNNRALREMLSTLHTEKSFRNLIKSNQNQIVLTISRLIRN